MKSSYKLNNKFIKKIEAITSEEELIKAVNILSGIDREKSKRKYKQARATRPIEKKEFEKIIFYMLKGFNYEVKGNIKTFRPNKQLALILTLEASLGLRISDVLRLKVKDIASGQLQIYEKKTNKLAYREISKTLADLILRYAFDNGLNKDDFIFTMGDRNVRRQLSIVADYLGYKDIGSHSFRKYFARYVFEKTNDIEIVRVLLNHSSLEITQRYIGVSQEKINEISSSIDFTSTFSENY